MQCEGVPVLGTWRYGLEGGKEACSNLVPRTEAVFGEDVICCKECLAALVDHYRELGLPMFAVGSYIRWTEENHFIARGLPPGTVSDYFAWEWDGTYRPHREKTLGP